MAFEELEIVSLLKDLPEHGLREGDVGTIVDVLEDSPVVMVEFIASNGYTIALEDLPVADLRPKQAADRSVPRAISAKFLQ